MPRKDNAPTQNPAKAKAEVPRREPHAQVRNNVGQVETSSQARGHRAADRAPPAPPQLPQLPQPPQQPPPPPPPPFFAVLALCHDAERNTPPRVAAQVQHATNIYIQMNICYAEVQAMMPAIRQRMQALKIPDDWFVRKFRPEDAERRFIWVWKRLKAATRLQRKVTGQDAFFRAMKLCVEAQNSFYHCGRRIDLEIAHLMAVNHPQRFAIACSRIQIIEAHLDTFEAIRAIVGSAQAEGCVTRFFNKVEHGRRNLRNLD